GMLGVQSAAALTRSLRRTGSGGWGGCGSRSRSLSSRSRRCWGGRCWGGRRWRRAHPCRGAHPCRRARPCLQLLPGHAQRGKHGVGVNALAPGYLAKFAELVLHIGEVPGGKLRPYLRLIAPAAANETIRPPSLLQCILECLIPAHCPAQGV